MGQALRIRTPRRSFIQFSSLLFACSLAIPGAAGAAVVLNEILPNPTGNDVGTERIEIYNSGPGSVDMTGWAIDDAATIDNATVRARIPEDLVGGCSSSAIIGPGEYRVLMMQGGAAVLNNSGGDDVYLVSDRLTSATVVHFVHYPDASLKVDSVWAAIPDGSANFAWRGQTLCASNGATGDVDPPGPISDLDAAPGLFPGEVRLTWTAPGDDGLTGTASAYRIRVSDAPITGGTFEASAPIERWINAPLPQAGATPETLYVFGMDPDSTWYFAIEAQDEVPNSGGVSNSPGTAPHPGALMSADLGYTPYFGNLHSHTSYSDGVLTPPQAYAFARNTAPTPLDFLAVTDHNHVSAGMSYPNYAQGLADAATANDDGNFVAIWGQEWGLASNGHVNIFEAPVLFGWDASNYDVFVAEGDYPSLYTAALAHPPLGYPVILEWCHPGTSDFGNYLMTANGQAAVHLMALVNGPATSTSTTESDIGNTGYDGVFQNALMKGFRVSPTADQDNHNATWGAATESRTAVLATSKTKSNILGGLAARRCYATQDHNVNVQFSADGHAMGEAFEADSGVQISVAVTDPDVSDKVVEITLYRGVTGVSTATPVAYTTGSSVMHWRELAAVTPGTEVHYYMRIRMEDNASIWTGPVYVTYVEPTPVAVELETPHGGLSLAATPNPSSGRVTANFTLPNEAHASLAVYDLSGRRVRQLLDRTMPAGTHQAIWDGLGDDGARIRAGLYFLRLDAGPRSVAGKVMVLR